MNVTLLKEGETYYVERKGRIVKAECLDKNRLSFAIVDEYSGAISEKTIASNKVFQCDFEAYLHCKEQSFKWTLQADKLEWIVCGKEEGA